jgi:PIN domain nuclease of toxin-antitoxin system
LTVRQRALDEAPDEFQDRGMEPVSIHEAKLHRDPLDRMLVAQARIERLPLLSADPLLAAYDCPRVPAA